MSDVQEYPKWVATDGEGHPDNPGHALVGSAEEEKAAKPAKAPKA